MERYLKIYTLGRIKITKGNEILVESDSELTKKWSLFLVLFFHSHETLSTQYLIKKLGMEENISPKQSLRMLIYRLRKDFEKLENNESVIITEDSSYTFNSDYKWWLDTEQFEELVEKAEQMVEKNEITEAIKFYERGFQLYHGHFLAGVDENLWILQQRQKYRDLYIKTTDKLTELLLELDKAKKAIRILEIALKYCPLNTEFHKKIINIIKQYKGLKEAKIRAEESASFFKKTGTKIPEYIQKQLTSDNELKDEKKDVTSFLKSKNLVSLDEVLEWGPITFAEVFQLLKKINKSKNQNIFLVNFYINGEETAKQLHEAEEILHSSLIDVLDSTDVICHWGDGHYIVLRVEVKSKTIEEFCKKIHNQFLFTIISSNLVLFCEYEKI